MRRIELLIDRIRSQSNNLAYNSGSGIPQEDMVQFILNAQDFLFSQANQNHSDYFIAEDPVVNVVNGQEAYDIPTRAFLNALATVEYSSSGQNSDFFPLYKTSLHERSTSHSGYAVGYAKRGRQILLVPPATSGTLRFNFKKELDRVDIRRGKISAVTDSGTAVTALTIDPSEASFSPTELNKYNYLCVVNRDGEIVMRNLEYDSIHPTTGVVTITGGSFTYDAGETISTSHYIVAGKDTANKSPLPVACERFLIKFAVYEAKHGDKSKWSREARADMEMMAEDIIMSFIHADADVDTIPITDTDYMDSDFQY